MKKYSLITICILTVIMASILFFSHWSGDQTQITELRTESKDGSIFLSWNVEWKNISDLRNSALILSISDEVAEQSVELSPTESEYCFSNGKTGKRYSFILSIVKEKQILSAKKTECMFLNYSDLPDIPVISIVTENNVAPSFDESEKPEWCMGESIRGNEYVSGQMILTEAEKIAYAGKIKLRVRGNTSANNVKTPYRIVLDSPFDLLGENDPDRADKDWNLIGCNSMAFPIGRMISVILGMEWQPQYRFVNLMVNGDWKGTYLLTETIEKGKNKINISDSGFIIEDDAYWWNEDIYFKTNRQPGDMGYGYTFKYPKAETLTENEIRQIRNYMNVVENLIFELDKSYAQYIDQETFSSWLLTHDLLGTADMGGSNIFFYKNTFNENNPTETKLKAGPIWDFDSIFQTKNEWSNIHAKDYSGQLFNKLFLIEDFKKEYTKKWEKISDSLYSNIDVFLCQLEGAYGKALQESWNLDQERWKETMVEPVSFMGEMDMIRSWFKERIEWMNWNLFPDMFVSA